MSLTVLTPIFNDWAALANLLPVLDGELASRSRTARLIIVDDGSQVPAPAFEVHLAGLTSIEVLHLRRNLGHQRAIAIGLAYLAEAASPDAVVVMDGDGEDRPEDVNRLLDALQQSDTSRVIFAERTRRSEGPLFALLYWLYRTVHYLLTGERVRVGNFSVIPGPLLRRLVAVSELWNHYAAAVFHARVPYATIPTSRGSRYAGRSQMNFVGLVTHGLSAMSVFGDRIGVRLLLASSLLALGVIAAAAGFTIWHLATGTSLPFWSAYMLVGLVLLVFLLFATSLGFVFIILAGRGSAGFLPFRDFAPYVSHVAPLRITEPHVKHDLHRR